MIKRYPGNLFVPIQPGGSWCCRLWVLPCIFLWALLFAGTAAADLVASLLPISRSVQLGNPATVFATIINIGTERGTGCGIAVNSSVSSDFSFQTTNPTTNELSGTVNTPVDIEGNGGFQTFVVAFDPRSSFATTDVPLIFDCSNTEPVSVITGVNTLRLSCSTDPIPDVVALAATLTNDGIVTIPDETGSGVFVVATVNVGSAGNITAIPRAANSDMPVELTICETDTNTGECLSPPGDRIMTFIEANETPSFGVFVRATGSIAQDPAINRIRVFFTDDTDADRGSTSVAVFTGSSDDQSDLVVTEVTAPNSLEIGQKVRVSATVENRGNAHAGAFRVGFIVSTDHSITLSDIDTTWGCSKEGLDAGATTSCGGEIELPETLTARGYYIGAYADLNGEVNESNEANNGNAPSNLTTLTSGTGGNTRTIIGYVKDGAYNHFTEENIKIILNSSGRWSAESKWHSVTLSGGSFRHTYRFQGDFEYTGTFSNMRDVRDTSVQDANDKQFIFKFESGEAVTGKWNSADGLGMYLWSPNNGCKYTLNVGTWGSADSCEFNWQ